jgi:hypothetical protein
MPLPPDYRDIRLTAKFDVVVFKIIESSYEISAITGRSAAPGRNRVTPPTLSLTIDTGYVYTNRRFPEMHQSRLFRHI